MLALVKRRHCAATSTPWSLPKAVAIRKNCWQHPTAKGTSVGVLFGALATGLQVLGQRKQEERYARYVLAL
jgi:hypothetical protein